jgi:hypothetical protein
MGVFDAPVVILLAQPLCRGPEVESIVSLARQSWFTEGGFDTADLKEAKTLLDSLPWVGSVGPLRGRGLNRSRGRLRRAILCPEQPTAQ